MRKSIAAAIAGSALAAGCGQMHDEGTGPAVSRNYQVGNFQEIEVAGPYDVTVRTGANPSVAAEGGQKLLDRTVVVVQGDKLVIHPEEKHSWFNFGSHNGKASFTVTVPQLSGAAIAGSGDIHIDQIKGASFNGQIAGSGGLRVEDIEVGKLKLQIGGAGTAKAIAGKAQVADYAIGGSGDIQAGSVEAQQAKIAIAGSGSVKARATATADVSIMGSGDVDVSGGAKCSVSKTGSGDVHCS
jgi:DUF4097 and DUF4098 domain-containing protein YvlB